VSESLAENYATRDAEVAVILRRARYLLDRNGIVVRCVGRGQFRKYYEGCVEGRRNWDAATRHDRYFSADRLVD
jgi:hypothetical protein